MKDMLGVEVRVGDVIVSASGQGNHKLGRVYAFNAKGLPMIETKGLKWDSEQGKYAKQWMKVSAGWSVLKLADFDGNVTTELYEQITQEYPSDNELR